MAYLLAFVGFVLLIGGGNMLVDGAVDIAKRLKISTLLIGLVLVGFGTSSPELMASLVSVLKGYDGLAVGNVIGSNIANILLVLGLSALIYPLSIELKSFRRDGFVLALSTICVLISVCVLGKIGRLTGSLYMVLLVGYIVYCYFTEKNQKSMEAPNEAEYSLLFNSVKTVLGILLTVYGAKLLVENATILARNWGVSDAVIGLTIVAVGTSLPELATSAIASFKKQNGVAFGNIVGSNIYNALFILGMVAVVKPFDISVKMMSNVAFMAAVTTLMCMIALFRGCFSRKIGAMFLVSYMVYIYWLFAEG